jgi:hypothetical protein
MGAAIAGTILVAGLTVYPERSYALAMVALAVFGVGGLVAAAMLPARLPPPTAPDPPGPPGKDSRAFGT